LPVNCTTGDFLPVALSVVDFAGLSVALPGVGFALLVLPGVGLAGALVAFPGGGFAGADLTADLPTSLAIFPLVDFTSDLVSDVAIFPIGRPRGNSVPESSFLSPNGRARENDKRRKPKTNLWESMWISSYGREGSK